MKKNRSKVLSIISGILTILTIIAIIYLGINLFNAKTLSGLSYFNFFDRTLPIIGTLTLLFIVLGFLLSIINLVLTIVRKNKLLWPTLVFSLNIIIIIFIISFFIVIY